MKLAKAMNQAMLAKLAWKVLTGSGAAWKDMLCRKYGVLEDCGTHYKPKQRSTQIWKGVVWGAELLRRGLRWEVRSGKRAKF